VKTEENQKRERTKEGIMIQKGKRGRNVQCIPGSRGTLGSGGSGVRSSRWTRQAQSGTDRPHTARCE
jgi:hypothetical protein